jgi:hypothetical protein
MKTKVPRPWDVLELSDGPSEPLTSEDWLRLYEGDTAKAEHARSVRQGMGDLRPISSGSHPGCLITDDGEFR